MSKQITLFMWGYQLHFRMELEYHARSVLQSIAPAVQPRALLVGIRTPEKTDGYPVCVEPEDEIWDPKMFFGCATDADNIYATHPDQSIFYGDAPRMRDKPENIRKKSVHEAVQKVTSLYDSQYGTSSFCGWPTKVEGYYVAPILQFKRSQLLEYPHLSAPIQFESWTSSIGLLQSVIECLLEEATDALGEKEPGRFLGNTFRQDITTILRDAGSRFCSAITLATGDVRLQNVFETLNIISSLPFEGPEAGGGILFAAVNAQAIDTRVSLKEPVPLRDHKMARKIVQMSASNLLCMCHGANGISGLGSMRTTDADGIFRVNFSGHYKWEMYYKDNLIIKAAFGVPQLPSVRLNEDTFRSNIRRIIPEIHRDAEERLWGIVEAAMEQKHGTMIVVSEAAAEEVKRLKKQSIGIEPIELTPDIIRHLTGIDGAIMVNPNGTCYAIGVILDGMATDKGDPSRGARYNSAIRYIASTRSPTICLVVSEDGHVNMLPLLRPQVYRGEIEDQITLLKTQNIENYHKTINWLQEHRFYLTAEQCDVVNKELVRIGSAPLKTQEIRLVINPFVPHPDMNESYYFPESGS